MAKDQETQLRRQAQMRVIFKTHALVYLTIVTFLWIVFYLTSMTNDERDYVWPVWPTLGWGLVVLLHGLIAYGKSDFLSVDREYERLKKR